MAQITHKSALDEVTIKLGPNPNVRREPGDICLSRAVAYDCPCKVAVLIRKSGDLVVWYAEFRDRDEANPYWHVDHMTTDKDPLTLAQVDTLRRLHIGEYREQLGGLGGALGLPVIAWAFGDQIAEMVQAYQD